MEGEHTFSPLAETCNEVNETRNSLTMKKAVINGGKIESQISRASFQSQVECGDWQRN